MISSSAFMRDEGTRAVVSRSTAELRAWRSCTFLFHHGDTETRRKTNERRLRGRAKIRWRIRLPGAHRYRAVLGLDGAKPRHHTNSPHARRFPLQLLRLIVRDQRVDNRLQLAIHHLL